MTSDLTPSQLLAGLDDDQAAAAQALQGPVAIIAGAGSGKTRTVSHRIAYGIQTGSYAANRVFALTYTNRAAAELRTRLRSLGAQDVAVRTFHSAALTQLQFFWPQLTDSFAPKLVTHKGPLIQEVLEQMGIRATAELKSSLQAEVEYVRYSMTDPEKYQASRPEGSSLGPKDSASFFVHLNYSSKSAE